MADSNRQSRFVVTGAGGRLGRFLKTHWHGNHPKGLCPLYMSRSAGADIVFSSAQTMANLPTCDTIVALWGRTSGTTAELAENSALARRSLALAKACGARKILHFSSAAVYGPGANLSERSQPNPQNPYGQAKTDMETLVRSFPDEGIRHCCLRLANVVGADSLAPHLSSPSADVTLDQFADGSGPLRSYIAPSDLARVIERLIHLPAPQLPTVLNVAAPHPVSMEDLIVAAGKIVNWRAAPDAAVQTVTLDLTLLISLLPDAVQTTKAEQMIADWRKLEVCT